MRAYLVACLALVAAAPLAAQEFRRDLYARPKAPNAEVLKRLNLKMNWQRRIPMQSKRDGFYSVQFAWLFDNRGLPIGLDVIVQTKSGLVMAVDAELGRVLWRTRVGNAYETEKAAGFNNKVVVVSRGTKLYGLNRNNGREEWRFELPGAAGTAPVVDEDHVYVVVGTRNVVALDLPARLEASPSIAWQYRSTLPLDRQLLLTRNFVIASSSLGDVPILFKDLPKEFRRLRAKGRLLVRPSVYAKEAILYVGARDTIVIAEPIEPGLSSRPWRFIAGGPVIQPPFVTDEDVYVVARGTGLHRVRRRSLRGPAIAKLLQERGVVNPAIMTRVEQTVRGLIPGDATDPLDYGRLLLDGLENQELLTTQQRANLKWQGGAEIWQHKKGERVLAVNAKFVYAIDTRGQMLVLDRETGRQLSRYDVSDYVFPISNPWTDRMYLAANDGSLICLRDLQFDQPQTMQTPLEPFIPQARK